MGRLLSPLLGRDLISTTGESLNISVEILPQNRTELCFSIRAVYAMFTQRQEYLPMHRPHTSFNNSNTNFVINVDRFLTKVCLDKDLRTNTDQSCNVRHFSPVHTRDVCSFRGWFNLFNFYLPVKYLLMKLRAQAGLFSVKQVQYL